MKQKSTKLREGDEVIVISGKDKGKRGNISRIIGQRCIVNDMNLVKRHTKPNPQLGITGGIVEKEMSIHLSNLMIWNGSSNKRDKISFGELKDKKVRLFRSNKKEVNGDIFNVGSGKGYSILDLVKMIGGDIEYIPAREGEARVSLSDISIL